MPLGEDNAQVGGTQEEAEEVIAGPAQDQNMNREDGGDPGRDAEEEVDEPLRPLRRNNFQGKMQAGMRDKNLVRSIAPFAIL
jgi:hypothetical protein